MTIRNYDNLTPCEFFERPPVKRCLIRFMQKYGGGSSSNEVKSFNGRTGDVILTDADVTTALGYTPPTTVPNLLIAATNASGNIVDGRANVVTTPITGFVVGANSTMLATDTILAALGKVQGQMNARITTTTVLTGYAVGANTALANTDNILTALGKVQGQINARAPLASPTFTGTVTTAALNATGNINVQGNISSAANTTPAGVTNTGIALVGNPSNADVLMFDSTRTVNNRTAEMIFFQGAQQFRFKNDAGSTAIAWLVASGGQGSGVTGITSDSGAGVWAHTGGFSVNGARFDNSRLDNTLAVTIGVNDYIVILTDNTAGAGTIDLPTASTNVGRTIIIVNAGTSNFTTDTPFISPIDPSNTTIAANGFVTLHSIDNNWYQIS